MGGKHDIIIMVLVSIIVCFQLILFYKNLNRILAFKKIIPKNSNIDVIELTIDEDIASSIDADTILNNKDDFNLERNKEENTYNEIERINIINQTDAEDIYEENKDEDDELMLFNKEDL
ncbi:hypothetical protein [Winogradskyella damuponensis]|uniref:Uncharacterized protein n=1 Tax=Winogradskyella damuponensis TaxID=943939 RepID=A0ABP8CTG0_9FLAO